MTAPVIGVPDESARKCTGHLYFPGYYDLATGGTDDAIFKAYRLSNKPTSKENEEHRDVPCY